MKGSKESTTNYKEEEVVEYGIAGKEILFCTGQTRRQQNSFLIP